MSKPKVLITGQILWATKEIKELESIAIVVSPDVSTKEAFLAEVNSKHSDALAIYSTNGCTFAYYSKDVIDKLPSSIKYLCYNGAGYDKVDVAAATAKGIKVSHTPHVVDDATATTALYLLIGATRRFAHAEANARNNLWLKDFPVAHDPEEKTLGIVGMGGIGSALARRCIPLRMKIQYYNRKPVSPAPDFPATYCESLDQLLETSDFVSLHLPLNANTKGAFGTEQFNKMKDGSVLINTARGGVVDEEALIKALDSGKLYSAGLDVFANEPELDERLRNNPHITILPHVGTHAYESRYNMEMLAMENLKSVIQGGELLTQVAEQKK